MESQAKAQDLLLAYDADFTGYTSVNEMARPLEPASDLASGPRLAAAPASTGFLGGTPDPDGYYDDFTARLDRFVRAYPRLGGGGGARALDWGALVVALDAFPDSDGDDDGDDGDGDDGDDSGGDDGDNGGDDGGGDSGDDSGDDNGDDDSGGGNRFGGEPSVISLGDYITDVDGGRGGAPPRDDNVAIIDGDEAGYGSDGYGEVPARGEMDESELEDYPYESFQAGTDSILGFVADK